jgi:RND family efflux transporter MFP subunit
METTTPLPTTREDTHGIDRPQNGQESRPDHTEEHHEEEIPRDLKQPGWLMVVAVGLLFIAALGGLFFLGWKPHEQQQKQAAEDASQQGDTRPVVTVATPKQVAGAHDVVLPCDVRPNQETLIFPRATGYLKKLYVDIQDRVEAGQLLAEIDTPEVDAQLEQTKASRMQAQANVVKAKADLDLAERTLERYGGVGNTSVTQQERDEKRTARDQAAAALSQAQANVVAADANVQRLTVMQSFEKITAPFSGIITSRNYDVGALLTAGGGNSSTGSASGGRELFKLTQADTLRVFVNMPQVDAAAVRVGQNATLTVRNYPNRTFTGAVARLAGAVDPNSRTMPFELHFANPNGELYAGMYGQVKLGVEDGASALVIPTSSLIFNAGGTQVGTVKDGRVHFQNVSVSRDLGTELEVTGGLNQEDQVITNPGERLSEGVAVQVAGQEKANFASAASQ